MVRCSRVIQLQFDYLNKEEKNKATDSWTEELIQRNNFSSGHTIQSTVMWSIIDSHRFVNAYAHPLGTIAMR